MRKKWCAAPAGVGLVCMVLLFGGCGSSGEHEVAETRGTVPYNGQPVPDVVVSFTPQATGDAEKPGKSASGHTDAQGEFVLSTYEIGDGAVVGKHAVLVSSEDPNKPLPGKSPPDSIVEIKPGANDIKIELQ
jgi:hypothetical protein